ncbi:MAG: hypothetical protein A3I61_07765 [Acidobacteria bacterium RIFCSPLOWO2_02_FULL_68_18]|nr:MAG: hypothetical protein A3I61_07765 [Acidobacteria bacterium RIFCSPLOWO2_02_FULL_68_18]OFW50857.1 MAG: hypothetical protein A3G77_16840 [Acidobacteria bacterium RIFCSPLOWO2_12_FULL_68_19]
MLVWVGKRPLTHVTAFPAQHVEQCSADQPAETRQNWSGWPSAYPTGGLLFHGDNKEVLAHLLANGFRGKVNLIYIDPPFDSGADYVRKVSLRGASGSAKVDGERYTLGEQIQYTDIWANDNYLQFMYERLLLLNELLSSKGQLFFHCDERQSHRIRCLLDEVFGPESFRNEIIWHYSNKYGANSETLDVFHNTVFWYSKGRAQLVEDIRVPVKVPRKQPVRKWNKELGKNEWLRDEEGNYLYQESTDKELGDVWEIPVINPMALERADYPTQKPEQLLEYILRIASTVNDVVLDAFVGSGTTAAVAQKLTRRWIGCDINKGAIQTTAKRVLMIMREQADALERDSSVAQQSLLDDGADTAAPKPAQLSFSVWRVNDYDLHIQHNEAVNLACEHIGVERARTDTFFDGTLGKHLVKIIPFDHPLSPVDLEELRRELESRPDEDREITLVCLGIETAARAWIDDWNRLRKGRRAANRVHVIELRSDEKYGAFIRHQPARARVRIARRNGRLTVAIEEFVSPSIVERLRQQAGVVQPKIDDWRAMVDCVMIDPSYDGRVFTVALSDIPERKTDVVKGTYEIEAPARQATVAVKIVDMLGEEVLVTKTV